MFSRRLIVIYVLLSASVWCSPALSQNQKQPQTQPPPSSTTSPRTTPTADEPGDLKPFDSSVEVLPLNYRGMDASVIYRQLQARRASAQKDEFETTGQFRQRITKEEAAPLAGSLMIDSLMAFQVKEIETAYDADRELMMIAVDFHRVSYDEEDGKLQRALELKSETGRPKNLAFTNYQAFEIVKTDTALADTVVTQLKMDIPTARQAKPNLRALAIAKLRAPYLQEGSQAPLLYGHILLGELMELWVYDVSTGRIFVKLRAGEAKRGGDTDKSKETQNLLNKAIELYLAQRDDEALLELRGILVLEPTNAEAYLLKGCIYVRRGDQETAISALKTAIFWNAKLIDAHILLGRIFLERNDRAQAMTYARSAIKIDPNNQEAVILYRRVEAGH